MDNHEPRWRLGLVLLAAAVVGCRPPPLETVHREVLALNLHSRDQALAAVMAQRRLTRIDAPPPSVPTFAMQAKLSGMSGVSRVK
ncbi:hypothetical protein SAMN02745121_05913 [Nannocystis exedens]|uniref:Uncharacterized protein n=2 Tax=Nannocystis exedens TaxID=54 RepID=A0A1I2E4K9_9BACT|nr:hypothetical protein NAEX_02292 [Nannocystis exedens]SFE87599.1 hypothetical protein SAMN02745121_05913 [Nannocystis exedens]